MLFQNDIKERHCTVLPILLNESFIGLGISETMMIMMMIFSSKNNI